MIDRAEEYLRRLRSRVSRSEWSVRRLGLSVSSETQSEPGLVMIHVAGLTHDAWQAADAASAMSFCRSLLSRENYAVHVLDAGDATAEEAHRELFFGELRAASNNGQGGVAHRPPDAALGLLRGGSNYAGLCPAGAAEAHYCEQGGAARETTRALLRPSVVAAHGWTFARAAGAMLSEGLQLVGGALCRPTSLSDVPGQLAQIPQRVRRGVLLRDFSVAGAALDVVRGLSVVHVNLWGYHDYAAERGPLSWSAQRALASIDAAIRRIWRAARRSSRRDYDIWIYSSGSHDSGNRQPGFVLLPADAPIAERGREHLHLLDLGDAALHALGRAPLPATARPFHPPRSGSIRVMTYNVHSCLGMDGKLSPQRIARVIAQCDPDLVALQELDVGRARTKAVDQAQAIARELKMEFHFHPAIALEEEQYGDAVLSRYPMRLVRAGGLPGVTGRGDLEPRGAMWVAVKIDGHELQFINTHLGLVSLERERQVEAMLGPEWLEHPDCRGAAILCGDLNALPGSNVCRRLGSRMADAQLCLNGHRPRQTFFARYPIGRIDHVFVSSDLEVKQVDVPRNDLIRRASDHLPLVVQIAWPPRKIGNSGLEGECAMNAAPSTRS